MRASVFSLFHTFFILVGFGGALLLSCYLHYKRVVKNQWGSYPEEWLPSISASIGDWFPERSLFQIIMAATAGFRFPHHALCVFILLDRKLPKLFLIPAFLIMLLRTVVAGVFIYVTSSDSHAIHDNATIGYLVLTFIHMVVQFLITPLGRTRTKRRWILGWFMLNLFPLIHFYIQHKYFHVPGAYSWYAVFEWSIVIMDALFEYCHVEELNEYTIWIGRKPESALMHHSTDRDSLLLPVKSD